MPGFWWIRIRWMTLPRPLVHQWEIDRLVNDRGIYLVRYNLEQARLCLRIVVDHGGRAIGQSLVFVWTAWFLECWTAVQLSSPCARRDSCLSIGLARTTW